MLFITNIILSTDITPIPFVPVDIEDKHCDDRERLRAVLEHRGDRLYTPLADLPFLTSLYPHSVSHLYDISDMLAGRVNHTSAQQVESFTANANDEEKNAYTDNEALVNSLVDQYLVTPPSYTIYSSYLDRCEAKLESRAKEIERNQAIEQSEQTKFPEAKNAEDAIFFSPEFHAAPNTADLPAAVALPSLSPSTSTKRRNGQEEHSNSNTPNPPNPNFDDSSATAFPSIQELTHYLPLNGNSSPVVHANNLQLSSQPTEQKYDASHSSPTPADTAASSFNHEELVQRLKQIEQQLSQWQNCTQDTLAEIKRQVQSLSPNKHNTSSLDGPVAPVSPNGVRLGTSLPLSGPIPAAALTPRSTSSSIPIDSTPVVDDEQLHMLRGYVQDTPYSLPAAAAAISHSSSDSYTPQYHDAHSVASQPLPSPKTLRAMQNAVISNAMHFPPVPSPPLNASPHPHINDSVISVSPHKAHAPATHISLAPKSPPLYMPVWPDIQKQSIQLYGNQDAQSYSPLTAQAISAHDEYYQRLHQAQVKSLHIRAQSHASATSSMSCESILAHRYPRPTYPYYSDSVRRKLTEERDMIRWRLRDAGYNA